MTEPKNDHTATLRRWGWQGFGALILEPKRDPKTGQEYLALGLTRIMALMAFLVALALWIRTGLSETPQTDPIPPSMLHTLWGLLGLKGLTKAVESLRKQ